MKKLSLLFLLLAVVNSNRVSAQIQYGGMQQLGLYVNANGIRPSFNLINGIRYKRFFVGLGADVQNMNGYFASSEYRYGYRYEQMTTSALFLDGRFYMNKNKNFFLRTAGGANIILDKMSDGPNVNYTKFAGGFGLAGIGFKARIGKELFYTFDVSYSIKQTRWNYGYMGYSPKVWNTDRFDFRQNAILVCLGLEIF